MEHSSLITVLYFYTSKKTMSLSTHLYSMFYTSGLWGEVSIWVVYYNLASHGWHGNCWRFYCSILCLPLWSNGFDLCVELDALQWQTKCSESQLKLWVISCIFLKPFCKGIKRLKGVSYCLIKLGWKILKSYFKMICCWKGFKIKSQFV